ncbi:hypothetical protein T281_10055 [Rhodomicrobium udaipurense JA643]|nr:hypothetical protein T281_10055 [Rhodomicrobium udaipurense JA643]
MSGERAAAAEIMTRNSPVAFDLQRFADAQEHTYARAVAELRQGLHFCYETSLNSFTVLDRFIVGC